MIVVDPTVCKMCQFGPCKLGDLALHCKNSAKPASVITIQDMVNYTAIQAMKV